jgi:NADPH2 dehydrogenase
MPGLFDQITVRGETFKNRIMVSPMCQYQAEQNGFVNQWHKVHYGSLALGGAGLVMIEATAVEPRGRISDRDLGLWDDAHIDGLREIVEFAHQWGAKIGIQLAHAGRKADLDGEIVAPSAIRFSDRYQVPRELTVEELDQLVVKFHEAAKRAVRAGFDVVEIHAAHGYLLHQFLSPISNQRSDNFGGTRENRLRFPLKVVQAVRKAVPDSMPVFIRVSGSEYAEKGYTMDDMIFYCKAFHAAGADLIDVSSGGNLPIRPPKEYAGYQVPFAEAIRRGTGAPVAAVGMLDDPVLADSVIQEERADMVAIARGFLRDKHWALNAARQLKQAVEAPKPYVRAYL